MVNSYTVLIFDVTKSIVIPEMNICILRFSSFARKSILYWPHFIVILLLINAMNDLENLQKVCRYGGYVVFYSVELVARSIGERIEGVVDYKTCHIHIYSPQGP